MNDMAELMALPSFRRFLFLLGQRAQIFEVGSTGSDGRCLEFIEGRRSLAFEMLREAENALPENERHSSAAVTMIAILQEAVGEARKVVKSERSDRYADIG
jgi:hypothetical protein